jgi:copper(I)-binding protein
MPCYWPDIGVAALAARSRRIYAAQMVPSTSTSLRTVAAATVAAVMLAACGGPKELTVEHAWVRLAAVKSRPAAAYFTLHGGPKPATLIAVSSDVAVRSEMHQSMNAGGMATMTPLDRIAIPAGTDVAFTPGGRHVMLFDVNPGIKPGRAMTLTFTFADGTRIPLDADVVGAGDPAPE